MLGKLGHLPHTLLDFTFFIVFLDGIVGEMDEPVVDVIQGVVVHWEAEVAFLVEVDFCGAVVLDENPLSDIKFATLYQKWSLYVFLDYKLDVPA